MRNAQSLSLARGPRLHCRWGTRERGAAFAIPPEGKTIDTNGVHQQRLYAAGSKPCTTPGTMHTPAATAGAHLNAAAVAAQLSVVALEFGGAQGSGAHGAAVSAGEQGGGVVRRQGKAKARACAQWQQHCTAKAASWLGRC